jgi:hypothetical protein
MFCRLTKEFLSKNGIGFEDRNIMTDPQAPKELQKLHVTTTPVTLVDSGFAWNSCEAALAGPLGTGKN